MIINTTYFLLPPLFVPTATTGNPSVTGNTPSLNAQLQAVIDRVEYDILYNALGYEQYNELKAQFNPDGSWITTPVQKWVDLVDGKEQWKGLRFNIGTNKISLLAYAVYCEMLKNERQYFSTIGLVTPEAANSVSINPTQEYTEKWNTFITMYEGDCSYRYLNYWNPIFFEWNGYPYGEAVNDMVSMRKYLSDNADIYDSTYFKSYEVKNRFGL